MCCNHSIQCRIITWTLDLDLTTFWLLHLITFIKDYYIYTRLGPYVILNEAYDKISENTPNQLSKQYPARNRNTNLLSDKNVIILFRML